MTRLLKELLGRLRFHGPPSDHFDGNKFSNAGGVEPSGLGRLLRWRFTRRKAPWKPAAASGAREVPPPSIGAGRLRATYVGHATVLLQFDGVNVLTDPIWSERAGPVPWAGPKRVSSPGVRFDDLPPIHAVLLSHNHYDHLDLPTLKKLQARNRPIFYAGLGNKRLLERNGITNVHEMDWWSETDITAGIPVTAVPAQHWSARGLRDHRDTLWLGFVIETTAGAVYFAGDTGFGTHFETIAERFPSPCLALLPIGAYLPRWFMASSHMAPDDAVKAHAMLRARLSMAIHFDTFDLADEDFGAAPADLLRAIARTRAPDDEFWIPVVGEFKDFPPRKKSVTPLLPPY